MRILRNLNSIFFGMFLFVICLNCSAEVLELISVASNGVQANKSGTEDKSVVSANGRYVAFQSFASNLVAGDTNNNLDIFVRDRVAKTTVRVNVSSNGLQANGESSNPSISADGRYIAFESQANNLVPGDINHSRDIFVHDRLNRRTIRVSVDAFGKSILGSYSSDNPSISADGRYVAFTSDNDKLVPGDTNHTADIFVYDILLKKISRVSVSSSKAQGKSSAQNAVISANGRYVAFESSSTNLVPGDTNGTTDVFVHDRATAKTVRVSTSSTGAQGSAFGASFDPSISANGRYITFCSWATNLVPGDTNAKPDIFVHDIVTHQTNRISVSSAGVQAKDGSYEPLISADGTKILFNSFANNLVLGTVGFSEDLFLYDRSTRKTSQITYDVNGGHPLRDGAGYSLSGEGSVLAFSAWDGLIPTDKNNNIDVIARSNESLSIPKADLQISSILKPALMVVNGQSSFTYKITNKSNYVVNFVRLNHLITNGLVSGFAPSSGGCGLYTNISICYLGSFNPGQSKTLTVNVKAIRKNVIQQLNVFDPTRLDLNEINNWLGVNTLVQ